MVEHEYDFLFALDMLQWIAQDPTLFKDRGDINKKQPIIISYEDVKACELRLGDELCQLFDNKK